MSSADTGHDTASATLCSAEVVESFGARRWPLPSSSG